MGMIVQKVLFLIIQPCSAKDAHLNVQHVMMVLLAQHVIHLCMCFINSNAWHLALQVHIRIQ